MRAIKRYCITVAGLAVVATALSGVFAHAGREASASVKAHEDEDILTLDHFVPHISTVPANQGEQVELFVRERVQSNDRPKKRHNKPAVLLVQGAIQPTVAPFDLPFENYSWRFWPKPRSMSLPWTKPVMASPLGP